MTAAESGAERAGGAAELIVYTRPGCPFCTSLRAGLRRRAVEFREIDIWRDAEAAAAVREIADGNETVPTVVLGSWRQVNPSAEEVVRAVSEHAPHLVPEETPGPISGALNALGLRKH
ncbi:glutaredoxin family protein [Saccharopolyspora sp. MS10]|uniref:glutaredoxin family protein n=1 Tax=Saccharopolyspora sp. MS10 TaxID=3385973 RepID=UPI0039A3BAD5